MRIKEPKKKTTNLKKTAPSVPVLAKSVFAALFAPRYRKTKTKNLDGTVRGPPVSAKEIAGKPPSHVHPVEEMEID